jgi:uncharacterized protein YjbI with pentapeptide repeats
MRYIALLTVLLTSGSFASELDETIVKAKSGNMIAQFNLAVIYDFEGADHTGAKLTGAYLIDFANLTGADLNNANLYDADLTGTILSGDDLYATTFCHTRMPSGELNNDGCQ